ncbi:gamma-glutamylputrescine oxidase [Bradyrhizobium japonicum]
MTRDWSALPSANSLWEATAEPARAFPVLSGERQADVVIIGAGYTGLSAAHHIAKSGLSPVVLEANRPGWGASGRNGGVITAKFRLSFREIDAAHGRAMAQRMYEIAHESTDMVEELVSEFGIASAALTRTGQVKAAHNETTLKAAIDEANWMTREMGSAEVRILDKRGVRDETGSDIFVGGVLNPGSGGIHPLNYLRGLADGVARRGVPIFQESPVVKLRRENGGIVAETPQGAVRAKQAIIATNSYSDLTSATAHMQRTLIPFRSAMVATEQLSRNLAGKLMPTGRTYTETKRMMRWFRMVDNRVIFGGRGAFGKQDSQAAFDAFAQGDDRHLPRSRRCAARLQMVGPRRDDDGLGAAYRSARRPHAGLDGLQRRGCCDVEPDGPLSRRLCARRDAGGRAARYQAHEGDPVLSAARARRAHGRRLVPVSRCDRSVRSLW